MKSGQPAKAKAAFERALEVQPDFAEASNGLGALLAQGGNLPGAIARFRVALEATPDYPDALNNLGYALLQPGHGSEALRRSIEKALALQPDFPEAFNNLGIYYAAPGRSGRSRRTHFRQAVEKRARLRRGRQQPRPRADGARATCRAPSRVLQRLLEQNPDFEMTYVTLARIYLTTGRAARGRAGARAPAAAEPEATRWRSRWSSELRASR